MRDAVLLDGTHWRRLVTSESLAFFLKGRDMLSVDVRGTRRRSRVVLVVAAGLALVLSGCGAAKGDAAPEVNDKGMTLEELATYDGADRQELLEAGAREEGKVVLFTSAHDPSSKISEAFRAKYPFIQVEVPCCPAAPPDVTTRALAEFEAKRHSMDVLENSTAAVRALQRVGALLPYSTPDSSAYPEEARDEDGYFYPLRTAARGLAVNTNAIPLSDAPKSWEELLDPKWKGMISIAGGEAAPRFVGMMEEEKGAKYLTRLSGQDVSVVEVSARALADMLIAGEAVLSPTITRAHIAGPIKSGAPVVWIPMDPVDSFSTHAALAKNAPHPHAALLWLDFILSPQAQEIQVANGFESLHPDFVKPEDADLNVVYFDVRKDFLDRETEWQDKAEKYFG